MIIVCLMDIGTPMLLVPAKTGVTYEHQFGGGMCRQSEIEGFLVPVSFQSTMNEFRPAADDIKAIAAAVPSMTVWMDGQPHVLALSGPIDEDDEAMFPVTSPWGPAWLIWENSD